MFLSLQRSAQVTLSSPFKTSAYTTVDTICFLDPRSKGGSRKCPQKHIIEYMLPNIQGVHKPYVSTQMNYSHELTKILPQLETLRFLNGLVSLIILQFSKNTSFNHIHRSFRWLLTTDTIMAKKLSKKRQKS